MIRATADIGAALPFTLLLMNTRPPAVTDAELLRMRMRALGLTSGEGDAASGQQSFRQGSSGAERIATTARRMLAIQGQDWRSSQWALGIRTLDASVDDVREAYRSGLIVRSWPMRGTVHVVAAEDIGWMQRATNHRVLAGAPKRRAFLGISDAVLDQLVTVSQQALANGVAHDRESLSRVWTEAGIEWQSNWRYHVIWWLCQNGIAVFGPIEDTGEPRLVLTSDWIRAPRELDGDDALAELAWRYASARGPVHVKDFAWWTGLTVREARKAVELAAEVGRLMPLTRDGATGASATLWATPEVLDTAPSETAPGSHLLLPAFDEHLLGYTDRAIQLDPEYFERIVPGRNGIFIATVVRDGRTVGTWKRGTRKLSGIEVTEFSASSIDVKALATPAARWAEFYGVASQPVSRALPAAIIR